MDKDKAAQFFEGLEEYLGPLMEYLDDNLVTSRETDNAKYRFAEFQFWLHESVTVNGIK